MSYRIIYFGSSDFGLPALAALAADPRFSLVQVVTQPAKPQARGQQVQPTPIAAWAEAQQLPVLTPSSLRPLEVQQQLSDFGADVFVVIAYGLILPAEVLTLARHGAVNVHASLLPRHRGASPIVATILSGDTETGISIMQMDAGIDTGPVIAQMQIPVAADETTLTLTPKLSQLAAATLPNVLAEWLAGARPAVPQPASGATYAPKLTKADGHALWDSALTWERKIRAFQPWPGVWANWGEHQIKFLAARSHPGRPAEPAGTIVSFPAGSWSITCLDGWLEPVQVQIAGRKPQPAHQLPGSYPNFIGSQLT